MPTGAAPGGLSERYRYHVHARDLIRSLWSVIIPAGTHPDDVKNLPEERSREFAVVCNETAKHLKLFAAYLTEDEGLAVLATIDRTLPFPATGLAVLSALRCMRQCATLVEAVDLVQSGSLEIATGLLQIPSSEAFLRREAFGLMEDVLKCSQARLHLLQLPSTLKVLTPTDVNTGDWLAQSRILRRLADDSRYTIPMGVHAGRVGHLALAECAYFVLERTTDTTIAENAVSVLFSTARAERRCGESVTESVFTESLCHLLMRTFYRWPALQTEIVHLLSVVSHGPALRLGGLADVDLLAWLDDVVKRQPTSRRSADTITRNLICDGGRPVVQQVVSSTRFARSLTATLRAKNVIDSRSLFWVLESILEYGSDEDCKLITAIPDGPAVLELFLKWAARTLATFPFLAAKCASLSLSGGGDGDATRPAPGGGGGCDGGMRVVAPK